MEEKAQALIDEVEGRRETKAVAEGCPSRHRGSRRGARGQGRWGETGIVGSTVPLAKRRDGHPEVDNAKVRSGQIARLEEDAEGAR